MLMNYDESIRACQHIDGWKFVTSFSVGGFEWLGFSKKISNKMIIISSQKLLFWIVTMEKLKIV